MAIPREGTAVRTVRTKDKALQIIAAHGIPIHDVEELRDLWGPSPPLARELARVLWDLQKQGEIKFNEIKAGRDSLLTKIRLSRGIDTHVFRANESKGRHPVGKDYTDPMSHHWIAQGGPIEKTKMEIPVTDTYTAEEPTQWASYVNKINPDRVRPILPAIAAGYNRPITIQKHLDMSSARVTSLVVRGEQLGWLTRHKMPERGVKVTLTEEGARLATEPYTVLVRDPNKPKIGRPRKKDTTREYPEILQTDASLEEVAAAASPSEKLADQVADRRTYDLPHIIDVVDLEKYPLISDLMTKEDRIGAYEKAAALLEGFDADLALSLLEKIQLTPLEKEVIAFVSSLR